MKILKNIYFCVKSFNNISLSICQFTTIIIVSLIFIIVCAGVFWRYVLNDSLSWSEETAKFLMVWMVFTASPIGLSTGGHAAIDIFSNLLTKRFQNILLVFINILLILFEVILIYQGTSYTYKASIQTAPTTGISMIYIFCSMPIGGLFMFFISLENMTTSVISSISPNCNYNENKSILSFSTE